MILPDKLSRVTYYVHPDATPETERAVLAKIYAFVISRHREKLAEDPVADSSQPESLGGRKAS